MDCPRCSLPMQEEILDAHFEREVLIDLCGPCQSFWFDRHESVKLTPGATLTLFRMIGERVTKPQTGRADLAKCPRCRARLRRTRDMQRSTRFEYFSCPHDHGRMITFYDFLREKDFIRPLSPAQVEDLKRNVRSVNCSNCGAPVDLTTGSTCTHCASPLSMLDMNQAAALVEQLQKADERAHRPVDPALPLELARIRRDEGLFDGFDADDWKTPDLVNAGLQLVARWMARNPRS